MEWLTTTTVLDRLKDAGDESAWTGFVERYRAPIMGFARKMGLRPADAEDVAQETLFAFLEAYRRNGYERGRGRLSQYLFGIAHNKILLARRKIAASHRQVALGEDGTTFFSALPDGADPEAAWEKEWRESVLAQCLEQVRREVSGQTYEAFALVVFEHLEPAQAAQRLGITRNAVFIAKHRVGSRLRDLRAAYEQED